MGTAIDLFVTYRFIKLLVTPFNKTEAFKLGIIDDKGIRQVVPGTNKPTTLATIKERNAYTVLHKLVFNIKKLFAKVPGLRTKVGTYASALFLLKDTFKEHVDDPQVFEKEFLKYLKENGYELDLLQAVSAGAWSPNFHVICLPGMSRSFIKPAAIGSNKFPDASTGI